MKYRNQLAILGIIVGLFTFTFTYQLVIVNSLFVALITVAVFYFINSIINDEENKKYVKHHLEIADTLITDTSRFAIIITKDSRIVWANDRTYEIFPEFLSSRYISDIGLDEVTNDKHFRHNNNIYEIHREENLIIVENITQETRHIRSLEENRPNIAIFQLDNYDYIRNMIDDEKFLSFEKELREDLINLFDSHEIYYQTIRRDRYQLLIPSSVIDSFRSNRFSEFNEIIKQYNNDGLAITYSMGVATNIEKINIVGRKAGEALDLAVTRGGAQVVLYDNDETVYYGGTTSMIKGNIKMKSRVMTNTLLNVVNKRERVYLVTHANPDSDAIASMVLMHRLLSEKTKAQITLLIDENISEELLAELQSFKKIEYQYSVVIDHTRRNLVVVLDTQSSKIISHSSILEEINDIIIFDHHQTPVEYIKHPIFRWIEPSATCTVELVAEMLISNQISIKGEKRLANLAIFGFLTDTNNMQYRVDQNAIEVLAYFVGAGGSISEAREKMYNNAEEYVMKHRILENVKVDRYFSILELSEPYNDIFLSQLANEMQEIRGIKCSIICDQIDNDKFKIKIRSNGQINSKILIEEFGGGGHARQGAGVLSREKKDMFFAKIKEFELDEE